jgi:hypothetical protein
VRHAVKQRFIASIQPYRQKSAASDMACYGAFGFELRERPANGVPRQREAAGQFALRWKPRARWQRAFGRGSGDELAHALRTGT